MNYKFYKTVKIKSERPRCPYRAAAAENGTPHYTDQNGIERLTASGNRIAGRKEDQLIKARARGVQPQKPQAPYAIRSQKNVANVKRWREENPNKIRAQRIKGNYIRRSTMRSRTVEPVTAEFLVEQRKRQNNSCAYCGVDLRSGGHQDHVIPIAKGGAHSPGNLVWSCESCNLRKAAKSNWVPFWRK